MGNCYSHKSHKLDTSGQLDETRPYSRKPTINNDDNKKHLAVDCKAVNVSSRGEEAEEEEEEVSDRHSIYDNFNSSCEVISINNLSIDDMASSEKGNDINAQNQQQKLKNNTGSRLPKFGFVSRKIGDIGGRGGEVSKIIPPGGSAKVTASVTMRQPVISQKSKLSQITSREDASSSSSSLSSGISQSSYSTNSSVSSVIAISRGVDGRRNEIKRGKTVLQPPTRIGFTSTVRSLPSTVTAKIRGDDSNDDNKKFNANINTGRTKCSDVSNDGKANKSEANSKTRGTGLKGRNDIQPEYSGGSSIERKINSTCKLPATRLTTHISGLPKPQTAQVVPTSIGSVEIRQESDQRHYHHPNLVPKLPPPSSPSQVIPLTSLREHNRISYGFKSASCPYQRPSSSPLSIPQPITTAEVNCNTKLFGIPRIVVTSSSVAATAESINQQAISENCNVMNKFKPIASRTSTLSSSLRNDRSNKSDNNKPVLPNRTNGIGQNNISRSGTKPVVMPIYSSPSFPQSASLISKSTEVSKERVINNETSEPRRRLQETRLEESSENERNKEKPVTGDGDDGSSKKCEKEDKSLSSENNFATDCVVDGVDQVVRAKKSIDLSSGEVTPKTLSPDKLSPAHRSSVGSSSDRDFLIDDEISDQPALVLNSAGLDQVDITLKDSILELEALIHKQDMSESPSSASASSSPPTTVINSPAHSVASNHHPLVATTPKNTFRKPRALSVMESSDGSINFDNRTFRNLIKQDINGIKTLLLRLQGLLQNAETQNPFERDFTPPVIKSIPKDDPSSQVTNEYSKNADEVFQENIDLKRKLLLMEQQMEEKNRTIKLLQQQMTKYLRTNDSEPNDQMMNATTQTDKCSNGISPRSLSDGSNGMLISFWIHKCPVYGG